MARKAPSAIATLCLVRLSSLCQTRLQTLQTNQHLAHQLLKLARVFTFLCSWRRRFRTNHLHRCFVLLTPLKCKGALGRRPTPPSVHPPVCSGSPLVGTFTSFHVTYFRISKYLSKNCDWFIRRLREVGIFENLVLDSLKTIILQICLDHEALSALSRSIVCNIVRNI